MHPPAPPSPAPGSAIIEAMQLARHDDSSGRTLLQPTDFALQAGARLAITGASGSGKSVFLRTLALLDRPSAGALVWHQRPVLGNLIPEYRSRVCYVAQKAALTEGTVEDNMRFPFSLGVHRRRRFDAVLAAQLLEAAGKAPGFLQQLAADLSGGEAQVMALVRVLQLAPEVMLLDEPTSALDPASAAAVEQLVAHWHAASPESRAYIWVSHDPAQVHRIAGQHLTLHQGLLQKAHTP